MKDDFTRRPASALGRRDLMKLGTGLMATAWTAPKAFAQGGQQGAAPAPASVRPAGVPRPHTGPGYKYPVSNRRGNNGPMDDSTRTIVKFVMDYNASKMTPEVITHINATMVDSIGAIVSGFEEEPVRVAMKLAKQAAPVTLKSTVLGYGITTTPELAAFANGCLIRMTDFNDATAHISNLIPGALAIGEALHSSGADVMAAIAIGYEVWDAAGAGEAVPPAMAAGKLMGLDEDQLANALTLALTPHVALNKGVGAMSMWKGCRSAEATKCGIWAALMAREGMTGPPQPFEGRGGLWSRNGRREIKIPVQEKLVIERQWFKRRPSEASSQGTLTVMPEIRGWVGNVEDIEWIQYDMSDLGEISDNPKWDPRNRETADHSMPFIFARALIDGDIYMDSFSEAKYMDPKARALMNKMTFGRNMPRSNTSNITIHKKNGEEKRFSALYGSSNPIMSDDELRGKFNRACDYMKVDKVQRDKAYGIWSNLRQVKDIGEAMQSMAKFGQPKAL